MLFRHKPDAVSHCVCGRSEAFQTSSEVHSTNGSTCLNEIVMNLQNTNRHIRQIPRNYGLPWLIDYTLSWHVSLVYFASVWYNAHEANITKVHPNRHASQQSNWTTFPTCTLLFIIVHSNVMLQVLTVIECCITNCTLTSPMSICIWFLKETPSRNVELHIIHLCDSSPVRVLMWRFRFWLR